MRYPLTLTASLLATTLLLSGCSSDEAPAPQPTAPAAPAEQPVVSESPSPDVPDSSVDLSRGEAYAAVFTAVEDSLSLASTNGMTLVRETDGGLAKQVYDPNGSPDQRFVEYTKSPASERVMFYPDMMLLPEWYEYVDIKELKDLLADPTTTVELNADLNAGLEVQGQGEVAYQVVDASGFTVYIVLVKDGKVQQTLKYFADRAFWTIDYTFDVTEEGRALIAQAAAQG
jgi:hypothetical protein